MTRGRPSSRKRKVHSAPAVDAVATTVGLVTTMLGDSLSTLDAEATLIDRLFGAEIASLFGDRGDGK
ncbi:hypothetical protein F9288_11235 [Sphingomonas sp. CL5.1]|uniref:hypothetical protein n=1 Tax=Sphingomonas sp. CL5.1 TaxID=2653203 RepID=UPI001583936C|nr:hypothetical protein [Sphingomonas sp. CL5.1]QKS00138.1 hypothetical protein F9288_11235 [Sphingomonas sp. CL5.1]